MVNCAPLRRGTLRIVGVRLAELDKIEAQIAELQARLSPKDKESSDRAAEARAKADESAREVDFDQDISTDKKFSPSENLKKLYREVAKSVHPDLADDEGERLRREGFMAQANRAYEEGDESKLNSILHEWQTSPESVKGDGVGAELIRVIRKVAKVKERLNTIEDEIDHLKDSELYQMRLKVEHAEIEGRDLLSEMAARLDDQITSAKQQLSQTKDNRKQWT